MSRSRRSSAATKAHKAKREAVARLDARKLVEDPAYRAKLQEKLADGTLHPSVQCMLWYYAYGKPSGEEAPAPIPVKIIHEYAGEEDNDHGA